MSRVRKDPRAERVTKLVTEGEARPRLDLGRRDPGRASGRPRRDPWREWAASLSGETITEPGRRRYDRSQRQMNREDAARFTTARPDLDPTDISPGQPTLRVVDEPAFSVFAVVEASGGRLSRFDRQVLGAARLLADAGNGGGAVVAIVAGSVDGVGEAGADRVWVTGPMTTPTGRAGGLRSAVDTLRPRHVLLAETGDSADLARRLSVALNEPLFADVEHLTARSAVRAIRNRSKEIAAAPPMLMTIGEDRAKTYEAVPCEARQIEAPAEPLFEDDAILSVEILPGDPATLALSETDFVASAGNGVTDFTAFRDLAAALKATPGASRVVCDAGLMPRAAQVGASGTVLAADCYLALGISGAPQHLQGVAGCEHVIAVNTDLHAAMIERAGLAIVQDAQLVMPELLKLLSERNA